jgi:hypothetical protein
MVDVEFLLKNKLPDEKCSCPICINPNSKVQERSTIKAPISFEVQISTEQPISTEAPRSAKSQYVIDSPNNDSTVSNFLKRFVDDDNDKVYIASLV